MNQYHFTPPKIPDYARESLPKDLRLFDGLVFFCGPDAIAAEIEQKQAELREHSAKN